MKYIGSKFRLFKKIQGIILNGREENQWYVEPFVGGCNSICQVTGNRLGNDSNVYVIDMWKKLQTGWEPPYLTKEQYKDVELNKSKYPNYLVGWCGVGLSFRGKWFGGYDGSGIDKHGKFYDDVQQSINSTLNQIKLLDGVLLYSLDYLEFERFIPKNSIIYCDPPYKNTLGYIDKFDHNIFWQWCRDLSKKGHKVFISEYEAPDDFTCLFEKDVKSNLSITNCFGKVKVSTEKLFSYEN